MQEGEIVDLNEKEEDLSFPPLEHQAKQEEPQSKFVSTGPGHKEDSSSAVSSQSYTSDEHKPIQKQLESSGTHYESAPKPKMETLDILEHNDKKGIKKAMGKQEEDRISEQTCRNKCELF